MLLGAGNYSSIFFCCPWQLSIQQGSSTGREVAGEGVGAGAGVRGAGEGAGVRAAGEV